MCVCIGRDRAVLKAIAKQQIIFSLYSLTFTLSLSLSIYIYTCLSRDRASLKAIVKQQIVDRKKEKSEREKKMNEEKEKNYYRTMVSE